MPKALEQANRVLKKKRIMYLSLKVGNNESLEKDERYGGLPKYYSYFEPEEINDFLEKTNFEVLENSAGFSNSEYHKNAPKWMNIFAKKK